MNRHYWREALCAIGGLLLTLAFAPWAAPLPAALATSARPSAVLDRRGREIVAYDRGAGANQDWGRWLPVVTLAAEDHRFQLHPGVDPIGIARAFRANVRVGGIAQGGSTIDQQLARRLVPRSPGLRGKAQEALLALQLRAVLGKAEVLNQYLSRTWYGNNSVGAGVAAFTYFGRPAAVLSLAQAATLAAIPRRPADINPVANPGLARRARDRVLARTFELGWINAAEHADAIAEPLTLTRNEVVDQAPHFTRRVLQPNGRAAAARINRGTAEIHAAEIGTIKTGLDLDLQVAAQAAVDRQLTLLEGRNVSNAAVVVVHNPTRQVRAYVGSRNWDGPAGQVDLAASPRSPGSALKPFLYARVLENGASLADIVSDTPGAWTTTHGSWSPRNYGEGSAGPVTLRHALGNSLNIPAVRLAEQIGNADIHRTLTELGLTTLLERPDHYGLGLVLGDAEVRLDELVAAYAAFASDGHYRPLRFRSDDPKPAPKKIFSKVASFLILDALDDPSARTRSFGYDSALEPDYPMSAKTGTSTGFRDNWAIGVTPQFTIGVWVGNADGSSMTEVSGITGAGPILREVADAAMSGVQRKSFVVPNSLSTISTCALSGRTATQFCPGQRTEWLQVSRTHPACDWHDASGEHLPPTLSAWQGADESTFQADSGPPTIVSPASGSRLWVDAHRPANDQAIVLRLSGGPGGSAVATWYIDGEPLAAIGPPWRTRWQPTPGDHIIIVKVGDVVSQPALIHVGASRAQLAERVPRE